MGIIDKLKGKGIDDYIAEAHEQNITVIDVREPDEFARGHIPGAFNVPLGALNTVTRVAPNKIAPLYVHCLSGARSGRACGQLKAMGYAHIKNIGGINAYRGPIER